MKYLKKLKEEMLKVNWEQDTLALNKIWEYICYSPRIPNRLLQEELLAKAEKHSLTVFDKYHSKGELNINAFKWGRGSIKVLITHGWASKAVDFKDLIDALLAEKDIEVWSFDAPGNGSSEGKLSNLILYTEAVKAVENRFGLPTVMIGHSFGAMANVLALHQTSTYPKSLISITPFVNLRDNFTTTMNSLNVPIHLQKQFFINFEQLHQVDVDFFTLLNLYPKAANFKHLLLYDKIDEVIPVQLVEEFLKENKSIENEFITETSHFKIIHDHRVIHQIKDFIALSNSNKADIN